MSDSNTEGQREMKSCINKSVPTWGTQKYDWWYRTALLALPEMPNGLAHDK